MAYTVMAYMVMAYIVMAHIVMTYIPMSHIATVRSAVLSCCGGLVLSTQGYSYGLHSYGLYTHGPYSYRPIHPRLEQTGHTRMRVRVRVRARRCGMGQACIAEAGPARSYGVHGYGTRPVALTESPLTYFLRPVAGGRAKPASLKQAGT